MKGRTPTADEKRHMDKVAQLGCIVCRLHLSTYTPAEIHHLDGKTKPGAHYHILPLCPPHHRLPGPGHVCRADGKKTFEAAFGTEMDLMHCVLQLLEGANEWDLIRAPITNP